MARLISSPWVEQFDQLINAARANLVVCSPYIGLGPCRRIIEAVKLRGLADMFKVALLTDLSLENMFCRSTDVSALIELQNAIPKTEIRFLPSLHAKVYVADTYNAIVTSSNLTDNGILRNFEYGVWIDDIATVTAIRDDVLVYSHLGSPISRHQLGVFEGITNDLRDVEGAAQRTVNRRLRQEFKRRLKEADLEIIRARAAGRTAHAIFADAILHLLRDRPMRTVTLHDQIQRIHPDLCDDSVDRVIDGQHFGKKWKHAVRTAQAHLRRSGRIKRAGDSWQLTR